jgi:hypothetical protein
LPLVGATRARGRVVRDGKVFTGGVTAGIDFALGIAAQVAGSRTAQRIELHRIRAPLYGRQSQRRVAGWRGL